MRTLLGDVGAIQCKASQIPGILVQTGFPKKTVTGNNGKKFGVATQLQMRICRLGCPFSNNANTSSGEDIIPVLYDGELRFANPDALDLFLKKEEEARKAMKEEMVKEPQERKRAKDNKRRREAEEAFLRLPKVVVITQAQDLLEAAKQAAGVLEPVSVH